MHYDFIPMPARKPLKWPDGKRLALTITFNLEYWDLTQDHDGTYMAGGPSLNDRLLPARVPDYSNYTWREYGHRVGIWRLYDICTKAGVPASCAVNASLCLERPQVVLGASEQGWEMVAHNFMQTQPLNNYFDDPEKEREVIKEVLDIIEKTTGQRPRGWLSSSLRCTPETPEILTELGLIFHNDFMNDEQPYLIQTRNGPLVSIPYSNEINDFSLFLRRGYTAGQVLELLKDQFDILYEEGAESGRLFSLGLHPHVSGHPYRAKAIKEFINYVKGFDGVWWASRGEIAEWYLANHASHIG